MISRKNDKIANMVNIVIICKSTLFYMYTKFPLDMTLLYNYMFSIKRKEIFLESRTNNVNLIQNMA